MADTFDYVIVGAGSAGCVLAHRLSEDASVRVLLLDAGPDNETEVDDEMKRNLAEPTRFQFMQKSVADWDYNSRPVEAMNDRSIYMPRGKILGGSSTFIAGMFVRGNHEDFDHWEELGNPGWSFRKVLPYFEKWERNLGDRDHLDAGYHGFEGPQRASDLPGHTDVGAAWLEASDALGMERNWDLNGIRQEGAGYYQSYLDSQGVRVNSANAYLTPDVRGRANLTIRTYALATRLTFEGEGKGSRATGVVYEDQRDGGRVEHTVTAHREVIVSCGVFDSPKLLMLSGIGPRDELRRHGIPRRLALPGVGQNLQDHLIAPVAYQYKEGIAPAEVLGYGIEGSGFVRIGRHRSHPDVQLTINHALLGPPQTPVAPIAWMSVPILVQPKSTGVVKLGGSFAGSKPWIDPRFLSHPDDMRVFVDGLKLALRIALHPAFAPLRGARMFLEPEHPEEIPSDEVLRDYIRQFAGTLFHPACTCRMGPSPHDREAPAVVDHKLQVHGIRDLRVVDASIMPRVTTGNTHGPVTMIAEKAADMIRSACR